MRLLTKCGECERLHEALLVGATQGTETTEFKSVHPSSAKDTKDASRRDKNLLSRRDAYFASVVEEGCTCRMKTELVKSEHGSCMSLFIDSDDRSTFSFPHLPHTQEMNVSKT